jgi:hypothetical protein
VTDYQGETFETVTWAAGSSPRHSGSSCSARCMRR